MASSPVGEAPTRFLDQKNPRCMVPEFAALDDKAVDLAPNQIDETEWARLGSVNDVGKTGTRLDRVRIDGGLSQFARRRRRKPFRRAPSRRSGR